jgi:hypothetical protein
MGVEECEMWKWGIRERIQERRERNQKEITGEASALVDRRKELRLRK